MVPGWPFPQYAQTGAGSRAQFEWEVPSRNWGVMETWPRKHPMPTEAMVDGWPFPQYAQRSKPSPDYNIDERFHRPNEAPTAKNQYNYVDGWPFPSPPSLAEKRVPNPPEWETFPRSAEAPTRSVAGWPFPSPNVPPALSQKEDVANNHHMDPFVKDFVENAVPEKNEWGRGTAPNKAEVAGWPFPSPPTLAQGIARNKYVNRSVYNTADPLILEDDAVPRVRSAPKAADVAGWPYPQFAQKNDDDIAKTHHVNRKVYDFVDDAMPPVNEVARERAAPKSAEVAGWP